jgi:hypothetical protein
VVPSIVPTPATRKLGTDQTRTHQIEWSRPTRWALSWLRALTAEGRDAFLYGCSALFAGVTALAMGIPLYRQWGQLAVGPYAAATLLMAWVARRSARTGDGRRLWGTARIVAFMIVLFGATVVPLALEVVWRSEGDPALHVQPEVVVVEQAGQRAAHGEDPYRVIDRDGHVLLHPNNEPVYELYYPYLPGMVIFGFSSGEAGSKATARLTDARIQFLVFSSLITLIALSRLRPPTDARFRSLQAMTVLPTAALPLATGGDDMPVAALMLLGLVAVQRRRPVLAGLALGAASSLKFTAWPLVLLAVFAVRDLDRRRAVWRYLLGVIAIVGPVVVPVALRNPTAFIDNVIRFPLGLAGVSSPAASALPGHILVSAVHGSHRIYVAVVGVVGLVVVIRFLIKRPPGDAASLAGFTGWFMLIAILLAPATRVGYLLYPIDLFLWSWMLKGSYDPVAPDQSSSGSSRSSTVNGVVPAAVAGETTTPVSQ